MRICVLACGWVELCIQEARGWWFIFLNCCLPYILSRVSHMSQSSLIGSSLPSHFVPGILCLFHGLGLLVGHHACWISKFWSSLLPAEPAPKFLYVSYLAEPHLGFLPTPPGAGLTVLMWCLRPKACQASSLNWATSVGPDSVRGHFDGCCLALWVECLR